MTLKTALRAAAFALLVVPAGCDTVFDLPTRAQVRADAPPSASGRRVRLITASEFESDGESPPTITFARADTVELTVPFQRDIEILSHNGRHQLYVELSSLEPGSAPVRLRVQIQDASWYDQTLDLAEFRHRFVYTRG